MSAESKKKQILLYYLSHTSGFLLATVLGFFLTEQELALFPLGSSKDGVLTAVWSKVLLEFLPSSHEWEFVLKNSPKGTVGLVKGSLSFYSQMVLLW